MTEEYTAYSEPEDQLCHKEEVVKVGYFVIPVFFALLVVCSCIGNLLVLVILVLYEKFKLLINILIFNLAVSDLLFTFGLPFWALYFVWGWTFGEVGCKAVKFLFSLGFYSSVLFLTLMTVQRYMAVVHPLSDWERCRCFSVAPFIIWMLSGTAALLVSLHSQVLEHEENLYCEFDSIQGKHATVYSQNVFFLIAFCIMGFCHVRMFQTIARSRTKGRLKTIKLIFCIGLVFFIGWAPYNIVMFLRIMQDYGLSSFVDCNVSIRLDYAFYTCRLLAFSHCGLNPVLYALIGEKFRKHLQTILKKMCSKSNSDSS
ncbi:chemokine XC receptor 1 [Onychostoma macrolepis]|uniref:chemokine XC receptor 1 n=1 Tax=Onychostoma macrolepis TaxID=369639 RepID=UPI00272A7971|nr:chemokine XC receptor 1 [Onychostoma macrolepis]